MFRAAASINCRLRSSCIQVPSWAAPSLARLWRICPSSWPAWHRKENLLNGRSWERTKSKAPRVGQPNQAGGEIELTPWSHGTSSAGKRSSKAGSAGSSGSLLCVCTFCAPSAATPQYLQQGGRKSGREIQPQDSGYST
ncbi:hypothetical protein VTK26DRAFT_3779 [Humicola hyalothermophila]